MTYPTVVLFLSGTLAMAYFVVSLFFLRFWRDSHDRLFAFFATAFLILAVQRTIVTLVRGPEAFYLMRAIAFLLIIVAIVDKNRTQSSRR